MKYSFLFILLTILLKGNSPEYDISGNYCHPNCDEPSSIIIFMEDSSFNLKTELFGGIYQYGRWESAKDSSVNLYTLKIHSPKKPFQLPPPQIMKILPEERLKVGQVVYEKQKKMILLK